MNKKGFTLIELLAVIVLIGILGILTVPNLLSYLDASKDASYNMLLENIVTSAQIYYEECEYGDLSEKNKYGEDYACEIIDNTITTTLGALANTGILSVESKETSKKVIDPRNNSNISNCSIKITKNVETNYDENDIEYSKVTYTVAPTPNSNENCPTTYYKEDKE